MMHYTASEELRAALRDAIAWLNKERQKSGTSARA